MVKIRFTKFEKLFDAFSLFEVFFSKFLGFWV